MKKMLKKFASLLLAVAMVMVFFAAPAQVSATPTKAQMQFVPRCSSLTLKEFISGTWRYSAGKNRVDTLKLQKNGRFSLVEKMPYYCSSRACKKTVRRTGTWKLDCRDQVILKIHGKKTHSIVLKYDRVEDTLIWDLKSPYDLNPEFSRARK